MSSVKRRRDSDSPVIRDDRTDLGPTERAARQGLIANPADSRAQRATGVKGGSEEDEAPRERASGYHEHLGDDDQATNEYLNRLRDLLCQTPLFDTTFSLKHPEPKETEAQRGAVERTIDWTGLDSFRLSGKPTSVREFVSGFSGAISDFRAQQGAMLAESRGESGKLQNVPNRDKFFHCMANCEGNSRGTGGEVASALISTAKEIKDVAKVMLCKDWSYGAASRDSMRDQAANRIGRDAGRSGLRCTEICGSRSGGGMRTPD